jgi:type IV secretory pathway VirB10-like protein
VSRCEPGKLDLDLDEEVSRDALADCLASGWTAVEIAEELGLDGADDVARWCAYHDLPAPRVAESLPPPPPPAHATRFKKTTGSVAPKRPQDKETGEVRRAGQTAAARADRERRKQAEQERRAKRTDRERMDAEERKSKRAQRAKDKAVAVCYERCKTIAATSRELGISEYLVKAALDRAGVDRDIEAEIAAGRAASIVSRKKAVDRRLELLAAAHAALTAIGATTLEIKKTLRASEMELSWARRRAERQTKETP